MCLYVPLLLLKCYESGQFNKEHLISFIVLCSIASSRTRGASPAVNVAVWTVPPLSGNMDHQCHPPSSPVHHTGSVQDHLMTKAVYYEKKKHRIQLLINLRISFAIPKLCVLNVFSLWIVIPLTNHIYQCTMYTSVVSISVTEWMRISGLSVYSLK